MITIKCHLPFNFRFTLITEETFESVFYKTLQTVTRDKCWHLTSKKGKKKRNLTATDGNMLQRQSE